MKSRLRHPINSIREPFGTAGLIVAMIALVAALGGTALAAAKLNSTQKKEVEKIAKKFAGKPGASGANGTNGTNGSPGAKGDAGAAGTNGTNGESVKVTESANAIDGTHCTGTTPATGKGGAKFEVGASKAYACNGHEGSPWTAGGTLPAEKTEKGAWGTSGTIATPGFSITGEQLVTAISFNIPLATAPIPHVITSGTTTECPGGVENPEAALGNLCIFVKLEKNAESIVPFNPEATFEFNASGKSGATLWVIALAAGFTQAEGTWAVTAG